MTNNKANYEDTLSYCRLIFSAADYDDFLSIIEGEDQAIGSIELSPVKNYTHNLGTVNENDQLLSFLYQRIKYYLAKKNMYTPKIQEGMALCASKVAIIGSINPNRMMEYIDLGDKENSYEKTNPFEEISRMLLISLRENPTLDFFIEHQNSYNESIKEAKIFFETIKTALNEEKSKKAYEHYEKGDIASLIGADLDRSNVDSKNPLSATKRENSELLNAQFDHIYDLYQTNIELQVIVGKIPTGEFKEKYLSRFQNKLIRAKRNVGIYQKTKKITK